MSEQDLVRCLVDHSLELGVEAVYFRRQFVLELAVHLPVQLVGLGIARLAVLGLRDGPREEGGGREAGRDDDLAPRLFHCKSPFRFVARVLRASGAS
jgi:hypothetical protein